MSEPKPATRAQIEALIWALQLDINCLQRDPVKYAKGIAILRARIDELRRTLAQLTLLDELLKFYQQLADSQIDLPEDAARVLRENRWLLYG